MPGVEGRLLFHVKVGRLGGGPRSSPVEEFTAVELLYHLRGV